MALHLIKLSVGIHTIADLKARQDWLVKNPRRKDGPPEPYHVTRMAPSRRDKVLDGGSIYWVLKRVVQVRQRILDLDTVRGEDGIERCAIVLDRTLVPVAPAPRKPFQGWRYLPHADAPADLVGGAGGDDLPEGLRRKLVELGAW
ncbi:MAG: DUF1489 domain-containing protein [Maricaulaceae bacterium]|jgi:hypothetical protein